MSRAVFATTSQPSTRTRATAQALSAPGSAVSKSMATNVDTSKDPNHETHETHERNPKAFLFPCISCVSWFVYFPTKFSTACDIASTPVRIVCSGAGQNRSECSDGNGAAPSFCDAAQRSASMVPSQNMKIGTPALP
jgi:hypothetical protein